MKTNEDAQIYSFSQVDPQNSTPPENNATVVILRFKLKRFYIVEQRLHGCPDLNGTETKNALYNYFTVIVLFHTHTPVCK